MTDSSRATLYRPVFRNGACLLEAIGARGTNIATARYAFGSGNHCFTYLGLENGTVVELRLSYYSRARRWDYTPGQQPGMAVGSGAGRPVTVQQARECFLCHTTALVEAGGDPQPRQSILGVQCEACHGPGRDHVEAVRRGDRNLRIARLGPRRERISLELCAQCHRGPSAADPHHPTVAGQLPRMHGYALSLSKCFTRSGGRLSCVTCHDPHADATSVTRATYNAACRSCHAAARPGQVPCPVQPRGDCVSCHMPEQPVAIPTNPRFRTHWIKVWRR